MNDKEVLSFIGLANKAKKIIIGTELVIKSIQKGQAFLVIIAIDVSDNTNKKMIDKCKYYEVPYYFAFKQEQLGHSIGKESRAVIAITDQGFSEKFKKILD